MIYNKDADTVLMFLSCRKTDYLIVFNIGRASSIQLIISTRRLCCIKFRKQVNFMLLFPRIFDVVNWIPCEFSVIVQFAFLDSRNFGNWL